MGGGPAGCAAATLLAGWGHGVSLVAKPPGPTDLGESIPPSTRKLFDVLGVRAAIEAAPFIRSTGNTVWWGSAIPRIEAFADGERGWQVTSGVLAAILLEHAKRAGVEVEWARADVAEVAARSATFVLDCTGRTGLLARSRGLRVYDSRFRTVAMVGVWQSDRPFDLPDPSHTLIESYDGGWAWSVPTSSLQERFVAVMVDPRTSDVDVSGRQPGAAGREVASQPAQQRPGQTRQPGLALYREHLGQAKHIARIIADAALVAGPAGWDASMYHAMRYVDDNVLLVGDAASFLDPVSSAGIKKALASGWLAAVAVHTALERPAMRETALAFFASREAEVYAAFRSMTERVLAEAAAGYAHPFWSDRGDEPVPIVAAQDTAKAFERLRQAARFRVARSTRARIEPRPAVQGAEIVMEPRLVSGREDAGVRYAFGVDLVVLVDLAPAYRSVPDLFAAYTQGQSPVPLPDFLRALATTLAHQWLVWV